MRAARLITYLITWCMVLGCSRPPDQEPALLESLDPIDGRFVGTARIVENQGSDNAKETTFDVTFEFLVNGDYSIVGPRDKVTSSRGTYRLGSSLILRDSGVYPTGLTSYPVIQGAFAYDWDTKRLLILEQWDAGRDLLIEVILERTGNASELIIDRIR